MTSLSPLCQLNGGCLGCCGHSFPPKEEIKEAIEKNTQEFQQLNPKAEPELIKFRDRTFPSDLRNNVCRNLIEKNNQLFCPLHPEQNQGKDLRKNHCDINHLCQTAQEFNNWNKEKQKKFLEFIKNKNLDNIDYSIRMDKGGLLEEFKDFYCFLRINF